MRTKSAQSTHLGDSVSEELERAKSHTKDDSRIRGHSLSSSGNE